jgi:triphosphatase
MSAGAAAPALPEAATPPAAQAPFCLEFALAPEVAARLPRHAAIAGARIGPRSRSTAAALVWQDMPDGALARRGLLVETPQRGAPRLLCLFGAQAAPWLPGTPSAAAPVEPMEEVVPVAAFAGRSSPISLAADGGPLRLVLLSGKLRAVADEAPVARLRIAGAAPAVLALARRLAADLPLLPAGVALAEAGRALSRGERPRPRRAGAPDLGAAETVEEALLTAIGHLLECLLYHSGFCRVEAGPEGVHQARVALRRLRSVLRAFRPAAACPAIESFDAALKALARDLGQARDLDVFLLGIGVRARTAMQDDRRIAQLLRVAEARRAAAYAALQERLAEPGFRLLLLDGIALLTERPWREAAAAAPDQAANLAEPIRSFGVRLLDRRWHRLYAEGETIHHLDEAGLHELRLTGKRMRYAAELFAPLWPGKAQRRFLKRLGGLQDALGLANDVSVARGLVAGLGSGVPAWAVGAVEGFAAARLAGARRDAVESWENLMLAKTFWSDV